MTVDPTCSDNPFDLGEHHACLTGDCPHETERECFPVLVEYIRELCSYHKNATESGGSPSGSTSSEEGS